MLVSLSRALLVSLSLLSMSPELALAAPTLDKRDSNHARGCINPHVRKEWGSLSKKERLNYINAVQCMQSRPSAYPTGVVPGSKSRWGDYAATHINSTMVIHSDAVFLAWHRQFVHLMETEMREKCGYQGYLPYWDWPKWVAHGNLSQSPLFDGSETSLGGDGAPLPDSEYNGTFLGLFNTEPFVPKGKGGGCVTSGPFVNASATMGPFSLDLITTGGAPANWTAYTPHCIRRDLNDNMAQYLNYTWYADVLNTDSIVDFQGKLNKFGGFNEGVHAIGHFVLGATMDDFFASPFDPAFYSHHAQLDRLWTTWQARDPARRVLGGNAINGTYYLFNPPNTPEVTFDTKVDFGILGPKMAMRDMMSTTSGPYCYMYE